MIRYNTKRYWGYSTDVKPINSQKGDRFLEIDTRLEYFFNDYNQWILIGKTDVFVTGGTKSGPNITFTNNTGGTFSVTGFTDVFVTGGTYNNGTATFTNNTGGTFNVVGFPSATGGTTNYYGSFSDTTNQPVSGANIATVWKYNTTEISNGIFIQDQTKIKVSNDGIYEIGYSVQLEKTQGGTSTDVTIWASVNGNPIDRSSSTTTLVANSAYQLPFVSYILNLNAGDYVEFYYSAPSQYVQLTTLSGLTTPTRPVSPSVIVVAKAVGNAVLNNSGDTYVTGFTLANDTLSLQQNRLGTYSGFSVNLPYLNTSGGTINGNLNVTGSLSASTFYGNGGNLTGISRGGGGAGSQLYYFNISNTQSPYYEFSLSATSASEQIISATTGGTQLAYIGGFMTPVGVPNITSLPAGILTFYLHCYDGTTNHTFDIYCELWKRTTGGTETLLFTSDSAAVIGNTTEMVITDGYFSGATLNSSDRLVIKLYGQNISNQTRTIYFVSEGSQHYSFGITTIPSSTDTYVTGGTKTGTNVVFTNNVGGTFTVTGFTDTFVTGATYSNNSFTYRNNTGGTFNVLFSTVTGLTVNGNLTVTGTTTSTTISATTYQNLPTDIRVTGGTYNTGTSTLTFTNNTGGTFSVTGITTSSAFTGGTVTGATSFTNGLTANTISATTYQNLPTDIRVTGATKSGTVATFTNNTGGTFTLTGLTDTFVTGGTYSGSTIIFTDNTGGTFNVTGITTSSSFTGGTVTGATNFTGGLTANTISATTFTSRTENIIGIIPTGETGNVSAGTNTINVYIQGDYAYVVNNNSFTLQIFDISNPSSPVLVGTVSTGFSPVTIYVQGRYVYVINSSSTTLQIFDVSNASSPVSIGSVTIGSNPQSVYVQGRYAYVVGGSNTLQIFDISNPSTPILVGSVSTGASTVGIFVQGRYAYVITPSLNSLQTFDISNPSSPVSIGSVTTGSNPQSLYVQGKYAYVTNNGLQTLQIFDISNPSTLVLIGSVSTGSSPRSVYVQGRYAYFVNTLSNTFQIIDVSNPSSPVSVGTVSTGTNPRGLYVQGRYVYVVNQTSNTLQIFDVGGSYIQQLEAGGILTNTLESVGNATIGNDLTVVGGLNVSQSTNILGNLSATNMRVVSGLTATTISATTISATTISATTISATTISATTISATTYQNLPVSGLTQGSNITITNNGLGNYTISSSGGTSVSYGLVVATSLGYQNIF